jgi:hypothetical protein
MITHRTTTSTLLMERQELSNCQTPVNPPVTYVGSWGAITIDPSGTRRLLQIWLWAENRGQGRGVLLNDVSSSGLHREFVFLKHFRATRSDADQWTLLLEEPDVSKPTPITMIINGENARVLGPTNFVGPGGKADLVKRAFVTDPRIELVPLRDRILFERYLESAFFNRDLAWTAP